MSNGIDLDRVFCGASKRWKLPKILLKAVATAESSLNERGYRFEQGFWDRYLKGNPQWKDWDPHVVSASYGLMQIMFVVAWEAGFRGTAEDLYNPVINVELGAKILAKHLENVEKENAHIKYGLWPIAVMCARYNGGKGGNPDSTGRLKNQEYFNRVRRIWKRLIETEAECEDDA